MSDLWVHCQRGDHWLVVSEALFTFHQENPDANFTCSECAFTSLVKVRGEFKSANPEGTLWHIPCEIYAIVDGGITNQLRAVVDAAIDPDIHLFDLMIKVLTTFENSLEHTAQSMAMKNTVTGTFESMDFGKTVGADYHAHYKRLREYPKLMQPNQVIAIYYKEQ